MSQRSVPMVRAHFLISPKQRERLERLARREGRSLSDVTRRAIDLGLDALEELDERAARRQQEALAELDCIRAQVRERSGVYQGNLVAETRAERERQQEEACQGD